VSNNTTDTVSLSLCESKSKQTTLGREFAFTGIGVFSGTEVGFTAIPSPENTGIVFKCDDVLIPAQIEFVEEVPNRTKLKKNGKSVQVVEHLLSALYGLGVDNALIDVNSDEIPILDASARDYINAILDVGIVEQNAYATELVVKKPLGIEEDNTSIWLMPDINPRITYFLEHQHPKIGGMSDSLLLNHDNYRDFIGQARTFVTHEEARILIKNNILGTDDESLAIVVEENGPNHELRSPKEFVYHKMLDMIGDISLAHGNIRGHLIGIRSGHFMNRKMARLIEENIKHLK